MDKAELREKVARRVACAFDPSDCVEICKGCGLLADAAIAIVGKACAEMLRADRLTDPWSVECLADHWAKAILAMTQETPDA